MNGIVKDTAGAPLSNVQIVVSGANRNALTDERGRFTTLRMDIGALHAGFHRERREYAGRHGRRRGGGCLGGERRRERAREDERGGGQAGG